MAIKGQKSGIGAGGKRLSEMLEESERLYDETGHYWGIEELKLRDEDPVKYDIFQARLIAALVAGREMTRMISASPIVREVAELCVGLYTPEGECVAQSTGIQIHIMTMGRAIQWMIKQDYEDEVGINEGDIFGCNDNAIAGMHPADFYDIMPIFWEGELIGWVSTVIMEAEIGAVSPGCMPVANVERSTDGFRVCCEKTGVNDRLRKDFEVSVRKSIRMPDMFLLDRRGAVAADIKVREEVHRLIQDFGIDYYRRASRELIEEERRNQLARIIERTVPGRYRGLCHLESLMKDMPVSFLLAKKDRIRLIPMQVNILPTGYVEWDFEGTGEWLWNPFNVTPGAMEGGVSMAILQTMAQEGRANWGTLLTTKLNCPYDSVLNPSRIEWLPTALWLPAVHAVATWHGLMSITYFARGFREEAFSLGGTQISEFGGYNQFGEISTLPMMDLAGGQGSGAFAIRDGLDVGGQTWNPETDAGNVEIWELAFPFIYLAREVIPDTGGFGKYRAGNNMGVTIMLHRTQGLVFDSSGSVFEKILFNTGRFGGYPGGRQVIRIVRNTNIKELIEGKAPLVHEVGDPRNPQMRRLDGEYLQFSLTPPVELHDGDVVQSEISSCPGGWGDPIERPIELIAKDLNNMLTTIETCRNVYCAEPYYDDTGKEWKIDEGSTKALREQRRKERLAMGVPFLEWWQKSRKRILDRELDPILMEMYASSMKLGPEWATEFRDFWALPEDFNL